jgi:hypothetical protein
MAMRLRKPKDHIMKTETINNARLEKGGLEPMKDWALAQNQGHLR